MAKAEWLVAFVTGACGRVGFDPVGSASDAAMPPAPSCLGLAATCGADATSSCCASPLVPGGTFYRSYDVAADGLFADMTNPATVNDFRLDAYEITVGRFRAFVTAGAATQLDPPLAGAGARSLNGATSQAGWDATWNASLPADVTALRADLNCGEPFQAWTDAPGANEDLPIDCITWFDAFAFCVWDGGFLPTEAEWNYAAAGGDQQRAYPWSSPSGDLTIDGTYANYNAATSTCINGATGAITDVGSRSPRGDGRWGQSDLAGNVKEWVLDGYDAAYADPCAECADLGTTSMRAVRGGSFVDAAACARSGDRGSDAPQQIILAYGARCARPP